MQYYIGISFYPNIDSATVLIWTVDDDDDVNIIDRAGDLALGYAANLGNTLRNDVNVSIDDAEFWGNREVPLTRIIYKVDDDAVVAATMTSLNVVGSGKCA